MILLKLYVGISMGILMTGTIMGQQFEPAGSNEIKYRMLYPSYVNPKSTIVNYSLSVDQFLDNRQIEMLICDVIRKEKPSSTTTRLGIAIYHKLDRWIPRGFLFEREYEEHIIAEYSWDPDFPENPGRLMILRDAQGNFLDRLKMYAFDHAQSCK